MAFDKVNRRLRIKRGIRNKLVGTTSRPRLSVFKSNKGIYAQIIDDSKGHTLTAASTLESGAKLNISTSKEVGKQIAQKATAAGITEVVFDRNGYLYHGKVQALAEGAREGGLKF